MGALGKFLLAAARLAKQGVKEGDILNVDVTTILNGYFGDTCRMYTVGEVSENAQNLIDVTRECLAIGVRQCRPGNRFGNIGHEIQQFAEAKGYRVVWQFCGHGVGLKFHEEPEKRVAAISFGGWADDEKIEKYKKQLIKALEAEGIAYTNRFYFLGYNAPYEVLRRKNEIIVEL